MDESVSIALTAGYSVALHVATRTGSSLSREAAVVREHALTIVASTERSIALFGEKSKVIEKIHEVAAECADEGWDGDDGVPVSPTVVERAVSFIRAIPAGVALPDVGPEPDGSIGFDWILGRAHVFSVSIGTTNRLAFAWIDGTDRGHGVARFDGDAVPPRVLAGIREITDERATALRFA
jgi:hypothetical protein